MVYNIAELKKDEKKIPDYNNEEIKYEELKQPEQLERTYIRTYNNYLNTINQFNFECESDFWAAIGIVYSWMPTILKIKKTPKIDNILNILKKVKNGKQINLKEIEELKNVINNSLTGTSKLLHFVNPKNYAIWDSRIAKRLNYKNINDIHDYLKYLDTLKTIASNESEFEKIKQKVIKKIGYEVSDLRVLEICIFNSYKYIN